MARCSAPTGHIPATTNGSRFPAVSSPGSTGEGRIIEEHRYYDLAGMMSQLGLMQYADEAHCRARPQKSDNTPANSLPLPEPHASSRLEQFFPLIKGEGRLSGRSGS